MEGSLKLTSTLGQTKEKRPKRPRTRLQHALPRTQSREIMNVDSMLSQIVRPFRAHKTPLLNDWRNSSRSSPSVIRMWAVLAQGASSWWFRKPNSPKTVPEDQRLGHGARRAASSGLPQEVARTSDNNDKAWSWKQKQGCGNVSGGSDKLFGAK